MSSTLVIFAGTGAGTPVKWVRLNGRNEVAERGQGQIEDVAKLNHSSAWLVVPGVECTTRLVPLTARNRSQLIQAAPYAVEDEIGAPIGDMHVCVGADSDEKKSVTIVSNTTMAAWISAFEDIGIELDGVVPDYLSLDADEDSLTVWRMDDRVLLRSADWGAGVEAGAGDDFVGALAQAGMQHADAAQRTDHAVYGDDALDAMAMGVVNAPVNLRQGRFAQKRSRSVRIDGWKTVAALAASLFVVVAGGAAYETHRLKARASAVSAETASLIKSTFPDIKRVVNPRVQVRQKTQAAGQDRDEFLKLSGLLALGLQSTDNVEIESLRYDANRVQLEVSVAFREYSDIAELKRAIEASGGQMSEGGSREFDGRRLGDVTVTR